MAEDQALDYSYDRPDPALIWNAGYRAVGRYLGHDARCLTNGEKDRLFDQGLRIFLFCQTTVERPLSGYAGGSNDADKYNMYADEVGWPKHMPLLYVTDVGKTESTKTPFPQVIHHDSIRAYYQGVKDRSAQMGYRPVGMYGPYSIVELLRFMDLYCYVQTAGDAVSVPGDPTGGWIVNAGDGSRRKYSDLACMYQMYGIPGPYQLPGASIDYCHVLKRPLDMFAWHRADGTKPQEEEDAMEVITYAQAQVGSDMVTKTLGEGANANLHWFSMSGGDYRHIGPDEKLYLDAILWSEAISGVPENKRSVRRIDDPQPDWVFTAAHRFRGRP